MKPVILALIAFIITVSGCGDSDISGPSENTEYRDAMRTFVTDLGAYAKSQNSDFIIIPQNGQELVTDTGEGSGAPQTAYLAAIDATGREDMFYGYDNDDQATPSSESNHFLQLCLLCEQYGVAVLATDYCWTHSKMDDSYAVNEQNGFISFAASERDLNNIPDYPATPYNENSDDVTDIALAKNFLYIIDSGNYATKQDFINAVAATNYDVIIMDLFHNDDGYTFAEIQQLGMKLNGGSRLVVCYMSIGEAEDYRYYWQSGWSVGNPEWLESENPDWAGNYKVRYWYKEWQDIIFGNDDSYLKLIIDAGYDGVYLDLIDAFEYFEE